MSGIFPFSKRSIKLALGLMAICIVTWLSSQPAASAKSPAANLAVLGHLSFQEVQTFGGEHGYVHAVSTGDMDGDSDLDIVTVEAEWGRIYLNDREEPLYIGQVNCAAPPENVRCFGPFPPRAMSMAVGDMDS
ncbi:MAG: hypothetical protein EHM41_26705, partial [Chloroflexi bacterium]